MGPLATNSGVNKKKKLSVLISHYVCGCLFNLILTHLLPFLFQAKEKKKKENKNIDCQKRY